MMSVPFEQWKIDEQAAERGWDQLYLGGRVVREELPWSYLEIAQKYLERAESVLDMGTGRGEIFATLTPMPGRAVATEAHEPYLTDARKRLEPLGVEVVDISKNEHGTLPFKDASFDLVLNRHEFFKPREVFRILKPGGRFLTQQVSDSDTADLAREFDKDLTWPDWNAETATGLLEEAGFKIKEAHDWEGKITFSDVGAIVYWLKAIPWRIKECDMEKCKSDLERLHKKLESGESLTYTEKRFLILAKKP